MKAEELLLRYQDGERNFQGVELRYSDKFRHVNLSRANFSNAHFSNCGLREANFDHAILRNATINANLRRASFRFADLQGASFCQEFHGANAFHNRSSCLKEADLTSASLAQADLRAVKFQNATLADTSLVSADLRGADLRRANLQNADLTNANLAEASLCYANLTGALLAGANITGAKLAGATLPDGTVSQHEALSMVEAKVERFKNTAWKPLVEIRDGELTASKFAGKPWLGADETWPICPHCQEPMQFFLQLNLDQLPTALASQFGKGLLQLFYCTSEARCEVDYEGWQPFSDCQFLRIVQPDSASSTLEIPEILADARAQRLENQFQPQIIVKWQPMTDYPDWAEVEPAEVSVTRDELIQAATDPIRFSADGVEDFSDFIYFMYLDGAGRQRREQSQRQQIMNNFMEDAAMFPAEGDKLAGWPYWIQDVEYPKCPTCDRLMDTLIFEFASNDHVPYFWGDVGAGYILQCPEHKEQVAFLWQC
ncbi:MAG: pentapeptide repeat-containing protein [Cyanobacteria bacterium P01_D01_bin.115]